MPFVSNSWGWTANNLNSHLRRSTIKCASTSTHTSAPRLILTFFVFNYFGVQWWHIFLINLLIITTNSVTNSYKMFKRQNLQLRIIISHDMPLTFHISQSYVSNPAPAIIKTYKDTAANICPSQWEFIRQRHLQMQGLSIAGG